MALTGQPWPVAVVTSAQLGVPVAAVTLGTAAALNAGEAGAVLLRRPRHRGRHGRGHRAGAGARGG
ncbi:MAG: hypothetical protein U0R78_11595 [Nocardioidaceae bacterium]